MEELTVGLALDSPLLTLHTQYASQNRKSRSKKKLTGRDKDSLISEGERNEKNKVCDAKVVPHNLPQAGQ